MNEKKLSSALKIVLSKLKTRPQKSIYEIAAETNYTVPHVYTQLKVLEAKGLAQKISTLKGKLWVRTPKKEQKQ